MDTHNPAVEYEILPEERVEGVTVVRDVKGARRAIEAMYKHKDQYFACDTEVRGWLGGLAINRIMARPTDRPD